MLNILLQCQNHNNYGLKKHFSQSKGHGKINVLPTAEPGNIPSLYTGHPSYAYPPDTAYAQVRGYPGTTGYPANIDSTCEYPGGAPPLGNHSGAPAPTGFLNLEA